MLKVKYSIIASIGFSVLMFIYLAFTSTIDVAVGVSIFFFIISPVLFYLKMFRRIQYTGPLNKVDKSLVKHSGRASHFKYGITVGGPLYLLDQQIIFQTNMFSVLYRHQEIIDLNQIVKVDFIKTMGLLNNGLLVTKNDNSTQQFIVSDRETWKMKIDSYLSHSILNAAASG